MTPSGRVSVTSRFAPGLKPDALSTNVSPCFPELGENDALGFSGAFAVLDDDDELFD